MQLPHRMESMRGHTMQFVMKNPYNCADKAVLAKNYNAKDGKSRLDLMKCMDMYHSKDLDKLAKDYVQRLMIIG